MTREYILQNLEVMCPIIFIDNPGLRDHVMSTLQDSLLIPKPKFKVGDVVQNKESKYLITEVLYNYRQEMWQYYNIEYGISWRVNEDELELVEEGK